MTTAGSDVDGSGGLAGGGDLGGPRSTWRGHVDDEGMAGQLGRKSGKGFYDYAKK
jgi:hypothetical protein